MTNIPSGDGGIRPIQPNMPSQKTKDENAEAARRRREEEAKRFLESLEMAKPREDLVGVSPEMDPSVFPPEIEAIRTAGTNELTALLVAAKGRAQSDEEKTRIDQMLQSLEEPPQQ